ncbi:MAG TPA: ABC transporter substrate-binding protein [Chloroflexota bacterium]
MAAAPLLAGCGAAAGPSAPPAASTSALAAASQAVVDAARKEGEITLTFNPVLTAEDSEFPQWAEAFNKHYGLNLKVNYTSGPSMPQMAAKVSQEFQAQRPASTDVWMGDPLSAIGLLKVDALEPVDWSWSSALAGSKLVSEGGKLLEFEWQFPGITYNTDQLKGDAIPKSLADMLSASLKGKVASTPYAAQFDVLSTPEVWGEQKTLDYVAKLSTQASGLIPCGAVDRVATGEFAAFALDCGSSFADLVKAKGGHLAHAIPSDAAMYYPLYLAVPRNAAHPNAAKLWAAFVDTPEAQRLLYKLSLNDHPLISGSQSAAEYQRMANAGVKFTAADVAFRQRNNADKLDQLTRQMVGMFTKK